MLDLEDIPMFPNYIFNQVAQRCVGGAADHRMVLFLFLIILGVTRGRI